MTQYIPSYRTNSYIDKMFCIYCNKCTRPYYKGAYNTRLCHLCGRKMFGKCTINAYTDKIPPRIGFSYVNSILPNKFPYIYYYGSYKNKLINF